MVAELVIGLLLIAAGLAFDCVYAIRQRKEYEPDGAFERGIALSVGGLFASVGLIFAIAAVVSIAGC